MSIKKVHLDPNTKVSSIYSNLFNEWTGFRKSPIEEQEHDRSRL